METLLEVPDAVTVHSPLSDYEIEHGKPMPDTIHGSIQANLVYEFKSRYRQKLRVMSEVTLATKPEGSTPDVLVYPDFALDFENRQSRRTDAPLLTIEIQSPSQSVDEMVEKVGRYFAFGVKSSWVVLPSIQAIMVYDRPGHYAFFHDQETLVDPTLNIELPLAGVFE
jgi:Uma2 family endonuclease